MKSIALKPGKERQRNPIAKSSNNRNRRNWLPFVILLLSLILPFPGIGQKGNDFRTFTNKNGKTIEAKAVSISGDVLLIKMRDGRNFNLPISQLSPGDQEWITEWQKNQAKDFTPQLKISFEENLDESTEQSGFVYVQKLEPELEVTNQEKDFELANAKATILLIVEDIENEDTFRILSKESQDTSVPAGETVEIKGKQAETKYATIQAYGGKYAGHAIVIENASGKIIANSGSRGWDKNPANALKASEGAIVAEDFEVEK